MLTLKWLRLLLAQFHPAVADTTIGTGGDPLDGRRFEGVVLEPGKTAGDADTLIFANGRFRSTACDPYDYGDGPYTTSVSGEAIAFAAETESPKHGKLVWSGLVHGRKLDGTLLRVRDGQVAGEKWVVAGEVL